MLDEFEVIEAAQPEWADADRNRNSFPNAAAIKEMFTGLFGDGVRLIYAKENGLEIGNNTEPQGCLNSEQYLRLGQVKAPSDEGKRNARRK